MLKKCSFLDCAGLVQYEISYDVGVNGNQDLVLCEKHYQSDPVFQQNILSIREVKK